jgi:uncharacterized alpha-E superfamily protein
MLSRVAESMFWMSRYIERAENTARFLDVNFHLLLDLHQLTPEEPQVYWEPLILVTSDEDRYHQLYDAYTAENVTDFLVFNRANPNSICSCIALARENARSMIESISSEMWEQINRIYYFLQQSAPQTAQLDPYNFYREIKLGSHLFQGIADNTLSRSEGWEFVQVGKYLERADNTARLIDVKYHLLRSQGGETDTSIDSIQWMAVLKSCSALEAFRKVYLAHLDPDTILRFLVLDRAFPRSLYFCIAATEEALWRISGSSRRHATNEVDRLIGKLEAEFSYTMIEDILSRGLHHYLEDIERRIAQIGAQIHQVYFAYHIPDLDLADVSEGRRARSVWSQAQQQ